MDGDAEARMPGDAEAAGALAEIREQQAGWRAGDLLTFTLPARGLDSPTAARVIRVLEDGLLVVECGDGGAMYAINPSRVVERLS
jgi:hypothetical protein